MRAVTLFAILILMSACEFDISPGMDETFGDQHFKSAVSAIELHKTRTGKYPATLKELKYLGEWDQIWIMSVRYEKSASGYNLFIERGWVGEPSLELPAGYKDGLGLIESNVNWIGVE